MKKVVLATFLACAVIAMGLPSASFAQAAPTAPAGGASACPPMQDAEYKAYSDAINTTALPAKAAAIEAYLSAFPQSCVKEPTLETLMLTYYQVPDPTKTVDAADRVLQLDPNNLKALLLESLFRKQSADSIADASGKQAALDAAASFAQKGLAASKPAAMSDADFKTLQGSAFPVFYGTIAAAALNKKDTATAIDNYKKELSSVPEPQTHAVPVLPDTYLLALAYMQSTPPDYLNCAFYAARFVGLAPEPYKSQIAPTAKYCYKKYHGGDDGYDAVTTAALAGVNPPAGFSTSIKAAPTPAEQIHGIITGTPDLATLAISDKEMVFQYGSPEDAAKVWDTIKGKSFQLQGTVIAATATDLQLAVSDDAVQSKTADFDIKLAAADAAPEEPKASATPAQKLAYKKAQAAWQKQQDEIAAATKVGSVVTVSGTYDSFTPKPLMINMTDGAVILQKAAPKTAPKPTTTTHHAAAKK